MGEVEPAGAAGPVSVQLNIPTGAPYLELARALAGKFAEVVGFRRDEVHSFCQAFAHAAEDVVALQDCAEGRLDIVLSRHDARVRATIACGKHRAELARTVSHRSSWT